MDYNDILYEKKNGIAKISINRPHRMNAFTGDTMYEMSQALNDAWYDKNIGVVVLTGVGEKAFCTGGDVKERKSEGGYGGPSTHFTNPADLIRTIPKVVIAVVNGFAIGGGNVLQLQCDLAIASETAVFGQVGPKFGSFDAGFGSAYLARAVGQRKARELWFLCRRYTAQEALEMELINWVVPPDKLEEETLKICKEILNLSPTAIKVLKASFYADVESIGGIEAMFYPSLEMYYGTEEAAEGGKAFLEKRSPKFRDS